MIRRKRTPPSFAARASFNRPQVPKSTVWREPPIGEPAIRTGNPAGIRGPPGLCSARHRAPLEVAQRPHFQNGRWRPDRRPTHDGRTRACTGGGGVRCGCRGGSNVQGTTERDSAERGACRREDRHAKWPRVGGERGVWREGGISPGVRRWQWVWHSATLRPYRQKSLSWGGTGNRPPIRRQNLWTKRSLASCKWQ